MKIKTWLSQNGLAWTEWVFWKKNTHTYTPPPHTPTHTLFNSIYPCRHLKHAALKGLVARDWWERFRKKLFSIVRVCYGCCCCCCCCRRCCCCCCRVVVVVGKKTTTENLSVFIIPLTFYWKQMVYSHCTVFVCFCFVCFFSLFCLCSYDSKNCLALKTIDFKVKTLDIRIIYELDLCKYISVHQRLGS